MNVPSSADLSKISRRSPVDSWGRALRKRSLASFSLEEILVMVAVTGIMVTIGMPAINGVRDGAAQSAAERNAQTIAMISSSLAAAGEEHVLPDSLGGAEATVMLLREGVEVTQGSFSGQIFSTGQMSDKEIEYAVKHLRVVYDADQVRLAYQPKS